MKHEQRDDATGDKHHGRDSLQIIPACSQETDTNQQEPPKQKSLERPGTEDPAKTLLGLLGQPVIVTNRRQDNRRAKDPETIRDHRPPIYHETTLYHSFDGLPCKMC